MRVVSYPLVNSPTTLDGDVAVPTAGMGLQAYPEGVLCMVIDITNGSWTFTVETYDGEGNWYAIKDAFGQSTARALTTGNGQKVLWQLAYFGQNVRVQCDGTGADQDAVIQSLVFLAKG